MFLECKFNKTLTLGESVSELAKMFPYLLMTIGFLTDCSVNSFLLGSPVCLINTCSTVLGKSFFLNCICLLDIYNDFK